MPRDFIKELRGDVRHEAIDIYNHIDKKESKEMFAKALNRNLNLQRFKILYISSILSRLERRFQDWISAEPLKSFSS